MIGDDTRSWFGAVATCAVVLLTLTGSTLAPVAAATPVPTTDRTAPSAATSATNATTTAASATTTAASATTTAASATTTAATTAAAGNTATVTLSGTVTYPNGTAAENVTIRLLTEDGGETDFAGVVTDADGSYAATLRANRSYEAHLWQANLNDADPDSPTNVVFPRDGVADFTSLGWVNTTTTAETRNYSFPVGHLLDVTVESESGAPVANSSVGLRDGEGPTGASVYSYLYADGLPTDAQGRMAHPPNPGTGLEVNGSTGISVEPPANSSYDETYLRRTVTSDSNVTATLSTPTVVSGTVTDPDGTPASNVTLQWEGVNGTENDGRTVTDAEGDFSVEFDRTGDYQFTYWQGGDVYAEAGNVTFPRDGVADFGNLGTVSISGATTTNFTLPVGNVLNVTVLNRSGMPVEEAEVVLSDQHPATDERAYARGFADGNVPTDSQGRMQNPSNDRPGIEVNGSVGVYVEEPVGTDYGDNYTEYDVQGPRNEAVVLSKTTDLSGTVTEPDGTPASNVTLRWWTDDAGGDFRQAVTDENGTYAVDLLTNSDYQVDVWQADLREADADSPTNVAYPRDGVADFAALGWHNTTTADETREFRLPVGHVLNVTVENGSGAPVANSSVQLADRTDGVWTTFYGYLRADGVPTDAQGRMVHPPNPGPGVELNGTVSAIARLPADAPDDHVGTEVTLTEDRDVTLTTEEATEIEGRVVGPDGLPAPNLTVSVINFSTGVFEQTTTAGDGTFSKSVPDGDYRVYVFDGATGDGVADAWLTGRFDASGPTDVGNLTLPPASETTIDVTDRRGDPMDAYTDVRGGNGGWIFTFGHGQALDRPSSYDKQSADLTVGTHAATVYDSWTHDVLATEVVRVGDSDRTATLSVDRFNGTRVSGAFGTTVVRDLQTPTAQQSVQDVLSESVNVRLFVLNATSSTDLRVTEKLPDGYGLDTSSVTADGPGSVENVTFADGTLSFDVRGDVSEVRYRAVPTNGSAAEVRFAGEFGDTPTVGQTALPAEANVSVFAPADGAQVATANPVVEFVTRHPDAGNVTDLEYRVDGGAWRPLGDTPAIGATQLAGLDDGQHTVTVRLVNDEGTVVTDTTTFTVDTS
ncbi:carboxypeptidase-like regulatory domain-containing protein [Halorussus salinus]|uniref:carboxypeptidase-like regulatory domain-containing protein n=1 Tax=Halorussus salinus TaxID=1364935 RepID=UPI0010925E5F|nr:carboxypeptidase-like regulatory domain-containing protein [Halorussus salinus]